MERKPIKTAPKDGTWVLLFGGDANDGYHVFDYKSAKDVEMNARPVVARWAGDAWFYAAWDSDWRSEYHNPTHWMDLP